MFVGRSKEISVLNKFYHSNRFEMVILYGRRRVGKTRLLSKFIEDKDAIFFAAQEDNDRINLELFSDAIQSHFGVEHYSSFPRWDEAFTFIGKEVNDKRTILIIDELPYLAKGNRSFMSILQHAIDHLLIHTNLMIILCGSYISFMEDELVSAKSPLYGRKTGQLKLQPLTFAEASLMFPNYTVHDRFRLYSICGGIPHYLIHMDPSLSVDENIITKFMDNASFLYDEPGSMLKQETRNPATYNAIVRAIADGRNKVQEISDVLNEPSSKVTANLITLIELGIVEKLTPIGAANSRKSLYKLSDRLFTFMYGHVYRYHSLIEQGMGREIYNTRLKEEMATGFGFTFQEICRQYLVARNQKMALPFLVEEFGTWWGNNPNKKRQEEMDIVGLSRDEGLYCECKYRSKEVSLQIYHTLIERSQLLGKQQQYYMIFSKDSFTKSLIDQREKDSLLELITLVDIDQWHRENE